MKKNILPIIAIALITSSCNAQEKTSDLQTESEKWQKELILNGEVGNPCREDNDWQKWMKENPGAYFGLKEVQSSESDFNSDGIKDGLFYFPAENCVGGNGYGSDFAMLVYSNNGQFLTNKSITQTIEKKIRGSLAEKGIYDIINVLMSYKGLGKTIIGDYVAQAEDDANCCPSSSGTFEYNPVDFTITIENKKQ